MKLGIICASEIANRRFMPALKQIDGITFVGLGVHSVQERFGDRLPDNATVEKVMDCEKKKAEAFVAEHGGKIFNSYEAIVCSDEIDAIYIPLPPGLHHFWAKKALLAGKHVLVEKPSTTSAADTEELVNLAKVKGLALHENYMFAFHAQLDAIEEVIRSGELGDMRLYRISFGFPMRSSGDFRYVKALGGGALIDAGGYTIKYATRILGDSAKIAYAQLNHTDGYEVDIYGSGALVNDQGTTVQVAFGMDNNYKCELEAWGSKGCLTTGRVLTAPAGFTPSVTIRKGNEDETRLLPADDAFLKSIRHFLRCIEEPAVRLATLKEIHKQAQLVSDFMEKAEGAAR